MRLDRLTVRTRFKNLCEFSIDFDEDSSTTVVVGRNGTGKSNLLEALTIIFRDLDLGETPAFSYELEYVCRGRKVRIDADPKRKPQRGYLVVVDGKNIPFSQFQGDSERRYLPNYLFGYYSGPSNRMEEHFIKHQERFYDDLIKGKDQPLRPLFYARPVHSQFVLLAFYMEHDPQIQEFLRQHLRIEGLDYALFVMREPPWTSREGDRRFWNARGVVSNLLATLYELALSPLRLSFRVPAGFRKTTTKEHLYLFLQDLDEVRKLSSQYESQQAFFKALESTYISELISELRMNVRARKVDGSLTFREMSEGEQQLLAVLGLLRFTREEESLFLLDEPDTHLNPAWSVQYLDFLREIGGAQENSHIIMATHDPLVVIGLEREQVQVLHRDNEGHVTASMPRTAPKRMSVASLLTSDIYGLRAAVSLDVLHKLDELRELQSRDVQDEDERARIVELEQELGPIDATVTVRDPMYTLFVDAMSRRQNELGLATVTLSPEQKEQQRREATKVLQELQKEEDGDALH